jgi:tetratricopeptide (TPR) repeat protein
MALALSLCVQAPHAWAQDDGDDDAQPAAQAQADKPDTVPAPLPVSPGEYLSGQFAESQGDRSAAIRYIREGLRQDPGNRELTLKLYTLLLTQGDIAGALQIAHAMKSDAHGSFAPNLLLATESIHRKDYPVALTYLIRQESNQLSSMIIPILQSWAKIGMNQVHQPVSYSDIGVSGEGEDTPFAAYHLALLNDAAGFRAEAEEYYDAALEGTKKIPYRVYEEAMSYYTRNRRTDKAQALQQRYRKQNPDAALFGEPPLSRKPDIDTPAKGFAELYYSLASVLFSANAVQEETIFLRLALYLQPDFPSVQFLLGNAQEQDGHYAAAIATYGAINRNSPFYIRGRIRTAYDLSMLGRQDEALKLLGEQENGKTENPDMLLTRGDILRNSQHFAEAAAAYTLAIQAIGKPQPQDWPVFYSRGICYDHAGQWAKAEADFRKSLDLQPGQPDVLNYLGYSWLVRGHNVERAKRMIEQAMEARPDDMHIIDSMGWAQYLTGDYDSAVQYLEQAIDLAPDDPTVNEHLGDVYWRMGRKTEARFQWERALTFRPDAETEKALRQKLASGLPMLEPVRAKISQTSERQTIE